MIGALTFISARILKLMERISDWQHQLAASGARFDDHGLVTDFGDRDSEGLAARQTAIVVPLTDLGLISASGLDAATFLNSQLTSNIAAVSPHHAQYSGYCTPKGRLLATMLVFAEADVYRLCLPAELTALIAQRLQKYVLRAKVDLRETTADLAAFGITGPRASEALAEALAPPPERSFGVRRQNGVGIVRLPVNRYLVICQADQGAATWRRLNQCMRPAGSNWWHLQTIRSGIATVSSATQEAFIPQMLAMDEYGAVNFEKGCYPGQEIVARTRYLGDLKRRLYHARSDQPLAAGDAVVADGKTVGTVTDAAVNEQGEWECLAVLQRDALTADVNLHSASGGAVTVASPATDILDGLPA